MIYDIVYEGVIPFFKHKNGMYFISPKKTKGLEKKEMKYHIIKDDEAEQFTVITLDEEPGNIIVSGKTIEEAKQKLMEGFYTMCIVGGLLNATGNDISKIKKES
jgi:hypothetical protein